VRAEAAALDALKRWWLSRGCYRNDDELRAQEISLALAAEMLFGDRPRFTSLFALGDRVRWASATIVQLPWVIRWWARRWRGTVVSVVDGDCTAGTLVVLSDRGNEVEMPFATFEKAL